MRLLLHSTNKIIRLDYSKINNYSIELRCLDVRPSVSLVATIAKRFIK